MQLQMKGIWAEEHLKKVYSKENKRYLKNGCINYRETALYGNIILKMGVISGWSASVIVIFRNGAIIPCVIPLPDVVIWVISVLSSEAFQYTKYFITPRVGLCLDIPDINGKYTFWMNHSSGSVESSQHARFCVQKYRSLLSLLTGGPPPIQSFKDVSIYGPFWARVQQSSIYPLRTMSGKASKHYCSEWFWFITIAPDDPMRITELTMASRRHE